jgi:hypothetical protein
VCTVLGPEFGNNAGKSAFILCPLYGLKSAGAVFHAHLASFMCQVGYTSYRADPEIWFKAETRPQDNFNHDILCVHHDPMAVLNMING